VLRFLLTEYRRLVVIELGVLAAFHLAAIVVYDIGIIGARSASFDLVTAVFSLAVAMLVPFGLALDATRNHLESIPGRPSRAGWYLGITLNTLTALVSVPLGFVQAGLRHYLLNEPDQITSAYLLALLIGFLFILWLGGVMGWAGQNLGALARKAGI
jgi:hypothetical protein